MKSSKMNSICENRNFCGWEGGHPHPRRSQIWNLLKIHWKYNENTIRCLLRMTGSHPFLCTKVRLSPWKRFRKYFRLILSGLADENHDFHHFVFFSVTQLGPGILRVQASDPISPLARHSSARAGSYSCAFAEWKGDSSARNGETWDSRQGWHPHSHAEARNFRTPSTSETIYTDTFS